MKKLDTLQVLRFVAAALVVFAHSVDITAMMHTPSLIIGTTLENFGAVGVDIFFVISGFIVTKTIERASSVGAFWRDRFLRVAPLYWLISLPLVAVVLVKVGFSLPTLLSFLTFWPVWGGAFQEPYLNVGWTLSFEMLFYLAFGLHKVGLGYWKLLGLFAAAFVAGQLFNNAIVHFIGNPIIIEFVLGVCLAKLSFNRFRTPALILGILGLAATLVFGYGSISESQFTQDASQSLMRVALWGVPSALIVYGILGQEGRFNGRIFAACVLLGDTSYSIYLMHGYVLRALHAIEIKLHVSMDLTLLNTALAIAGGFVGFLLIEKPLRAILKQWTKTGRLSFIPVRDATPASAERAPARDAQES